jgi:hypothetical protein
MSNPLVNRWGSNIYWSKLWYSDKNYTLNLKQDSIFINLLKIYFMYGLQTPKNLFVLKYWYFTYVSKNKLNHSYVQNKYYRRYTKNLSVAENQDSYNLRIVTKDVFPMKIWIFKFHNWILLNFYWFQPLKKSARKLSKRQPKTFSLLQQNSLEVTSSLRRYKTFISKNLFQSFVKQNYYKF